MPDNFEKFIFLGVVVAVALFSRLAYPAFSGSSYNASSASSTGSAATADASFIVLPSPPSGFGSRGNNTGTLATTDASGNITSTSPFVRVSGTPAPAITAQASMVADLQTGTLFFGSNVDKRWPLASVTKLMAATVVMDNLNLNQKITVPPEAVAADPSQQVLVSGDTYTVSDLLHVLLLPSSNVAAETLADYYGRTRFVAEMNGRAAAWGMANTHYDDPSGLSVGDQSTPTDLLTLAQKIYADYPEILAVTRTPQISITEESTGKKVIVRSINDFAGRSDFVGGKTGYTDEADGNLLSIFKYEDRPILVIVMGTSDDHRFANTLMLYNWFIQNYK
jgi:D-alanyl-D-alanine endopeptidase (penicillin-binding protein 7)